MGHVEYIASVEEYQDALARLPRNERFLRWRAILSAHYYMPERRGTSFDLYEVLFVASTNALNASYGALGSRVYERLPLHCHEAIDLRSHWKMEVLCILDKDSNGQSVWVLRNEVALALEKLGWVGSWYDVDAVHNMFLDAADEEELTATERKAFSTIRVGQNVFRDKLKALWRSCSVTGVGPERVLKASHIKPWRKSNKREKLDVYNGFLLTPNLDTLFDAGYITFSDDGDLVCSQSLSSSEFTALGVVKGMRLRNIYHENQTYLAYHREYIFKG